VNIEAGVLSAEEGRLGEIVFAGFSLSSSFQPIYSLAHRQAVAYEGLIRAADGRGCELTPPELFMKAPHGEPRVRLDRLCRRLHVGNFLRLAENVPGARSWLFLNVDPYVATEGKHHGSFFAQMLGEHGLPPHRVAVELIETSVEDEQRLATAVEYYRSLGCLIVIDDFGAGHSNFDRIWRLRPDVVKIDREMTRRVGTEPLARRMFSGIVQLMHEAGALVCVEGIETEAEALCAIDAGADLVQGFFFARPAAVPPAGEESRQLFASLFTGFRESVVGMQGRRLDRMKPYIAALTAAVDNLYGGLEFAPAVRSLLECDHVQRCYLIAADGSQIGDNLEAARNPHARDPRLEPMRPGAGTNWQTKPYFRRAIESPGKAQVTRPYMSVTGPKLCVTLSLAFKTGEGVQVLCADLDFSELAGEDSGFA